MKNKKETFETMMQSFSYQYDLRTVFDDFLTMSICAFGQNPLTRKSFDEDLYLETIAKYKHDKLRFEFSTLLAALVIEMEERVDSEQGNDVLGDFYEVNLYRKGASQYFTPWNICVLMASILGQREESTDRVLRALDPCCGSGRMLLAQAKHTGWEHEYYGIDIDHTCVKMAALNLFLNGIFHAEVMWSDALAPDDFRMSYALSFLPFGIFRIGDKEKSRLWHLHKNSFALKPKKTLAPALDIKLPSECNESGFGTNVSQITLF